MTWLACWLSEWMTDWLTKWLADWLTDWLSKKQKTVGLTVRQTDRKIKTDRRKDKRTDRKTDRPTDGQTGKKDRKKQTVQTNCGPSVWITYACCGYSDVLLSRWLTECLSNQMTDGQRKTDRLTDWLIDGLSTCHNTTLLSINGRIR